MSRLFIFILLFFSLSVSAQNFDVKSFRELSQDMDARINYPVSDQNGEKAALIKIVTVERGFEFEGGMLGIVKTEQKTGEIWVYVSHGSKKITIKHANLGVLRNYIYPETIKEATVYEMILVSGKVRTIVEELEIAAQWLVVKSEPEGATFYLDGKEIGETPLNRKYKEGVYDYRIEYPRYHSVIGKLEIAGEKKMISHALKPKFGNINVNSEPENGMEIFINGISTGETTPALLDSIDSGEQKIGLKSKWYQNQTQTVLVEDEAQSDVVFAMKPAYAEVDIVSTEGANILLDGEKQAVGAWNTRLLEGVYEITVEKDHHHTRTKYLDVQTGKTISLNLTLEPKMGNVDVVSTPIGADIFIDGIAFGTTPNTISGLMCGKHNLELTFVGYAKHSQTFEILMNKTLIIDTVLRNASKFIIESLPIGAEVLIDDVYYGKTPLQVELGFGTYDLLVRNGKAIERGNILVNADMKNSFFADLRSKADKREIALWEKAERADEIKLYQDYLDAYPNGHYKVDAENAILRLKRNLDNSHYQQAVNSSLLADYESYLALFPNGDHIKSVHEVLENTYFTLGNDAFDKKDYSSAKYYFRKYLDTFSNTERRNLVMKKMNKADRIESRLDNVFFMYNLDTESEIGVSLGGLKQKQMGVYYAAKCNLHWLATGSQVLHTKSEYQLYHNAVYQGKSRIGNVAFSVGITYPVFYPLWVYAGVGLGYYPQYDLYKSELGIDDWVRNDDDSSDRYYAEGGVMLNFGRNYTFKYGMLMHENLVHQFGIAVRF